MMVAEKARHSAILGTGACLPARVLTNRDLEAMVDTSDEWIVTRTGIRERRIASPEQATSDLAYEAALQACANASVSPEDLDLIIVATVVPDMPFPSTACLVQARLGAKKAAAFDIEAACSGFVYALAIAHQFVANGVYDKILIIGAETLSRVTDFTDRTTCVLLGDAAGACVIGPARDGRGILSLHLGADGGGADLLKQPAGGSRLPATHETVDKRQHFVSMHGSQVFKFAVKTMDSAVRRVLDECGLTTDDVSLLIPHQANLRIMEAAAQRLGISMDRVYVNIDKYGNTSAASVPVALHEAWEGGRIKEGDVVVLVAFGGGLTWGSAVIRW
jgi:3-oxoacyl-[acyl-carrier-protein] synthase-3